jgi:hypothetical protein
MRVALAALAVAFLWGMRGRAVAEIVLTPGAAPCSVLFGTPVYPIPPFELEWLADYLRTQSFKDHRAWTPIPDTRVVEIWVWVREYCAKFPLVRDNAHVFDGVRAYIAANPPN